MTLRRITIEGEMRQWAKALLTEVEPLRPEITPPTWNTPPTTPPKESP